jgi:olefin beta-lactone synthetase
MSVSSDVIAAIAGHATAYPTREALVFPDGRNDWGSITYGDLVARVRRTASGLAARGVGRGARVVVLVPISPDLYVVLLAIASLGAIAVFVEPAATPAEMARAIRVTRPAAFVGIPKAHVLRFLDRDVGRVPLAVVVGSSRVARALQAVALGDLERDAAPPPYVRSPDDPLLLTFSSGSTGTPKGAVRSGAFLAAQHDAMARLLGADDHGSTPYVHVSAFAIVLLSTLVSGGTAVIPPIGKGVDQVDAAAVLDVIAARKVTTISGSPAFLAPLIAEAARRGAGELGSLRRILTGGAPVPVDLCERALEVLPSTCHFVVAYGSTEAEPIATVDARDVAAEAAAIRRGEGLLAGAVWPDLQLRLLRPSSAPVAIGPGGLAALEVAPGEVGEVVVAGPHVNKRYYQDKAAERANKIVDENGVIWHRTGDTARFDAGGRLWLVGRVADIVHRGDTAYHPAAVEAAARALPWIGRAALVEDGRGGSLLVVEPSAGVPRLSARARAGEAVRHLAAHGVAVDAVRVTQHLPVDPRHRAKLDYPTIRRRFA